MEDGPWSQKILRRVKRWTHLIKALSGYLQPAKSQNVVTIMANLCYQMYPEEKIIYLIAFFSKSRS